MRKQSLATKQFGGRKNMTMTITINILIFKLTIKLEIIKRRKTNKSVD
nr:MAG TPA: hypothetical protein [Caudoviricetes sp.]